MNRINHIRQTLPVNLKENKSPFVQFLLLDYNSQDGLDDYIRNTFQNELADGSLVYYKHKTATCFDRSHSRNIAMKLATGDVVCNIDADNYAGPAFGLYVQDIFSKRKNLCLTGLQNQWKHDASGKLCISKSDFLQVSGYDENFEGYGFEDYDIVNRLQLYGCETFTINKPEFLNAISHENIERLNNENFCKNVITVSVHYIDPNTSSLLFLLKDGIFITGDVVNNYNLGSEFPRIESGEPEFPNEHFSIQNGWQLGRWLMKADQIVLSRNNFQDIYYKVCKHGQKSFVNSTREYFEITELTMKLDAISFYTQSINREIMYNNVSSKNVRSNKVFGNGIVYKNFQDEPVEIFN